MASTLPVLSSPPAPTASVMPPTDCSVPLLLTLLAVTVPAPVEVAANVVVPPVSFRNVPVSVIALAVLLPPWITPVLFSVSAETASLSPNSMPPALLASVAPVAVMPSVPVAAWMVPALPSALPVPSSSVRSRPARSAALAWLTSFAICSVASWLAWIVPLLVSVPVRVRLVMPPDCSDSSHVPLLSRLVAVTMLPALACTQPLWLLPAAGLFVMAAAFNVSVPSLSR